MSKRLVRWEFIGVQMKFIEIHVWGVVIETKKKDY